MRTRLLCVAATPVGAAFVLGLVLWTSPAQAAPKKDDKANPNEVSQIVETECNLTDEQKEKVAKIKEAKEKDIAAKMEKIEKAKQTAASTKENRKRGQMEEQIKAAEKQMETYERSWDPKIVAVLKPDQKILLFTRLIDKRVKEEFTGISFTEDQSEKLKKLQEATAKNVASTGTLGSAQLIGMYREILKSIMTKDQRDEYAKYKARDAKKNHK